MLEARPEGTRRRGRTRKEWIQYMGEVTEKTGKSIQQAKQLAGNRNEYRKWLENPTLRGTVG